MIYTFSNVIFGFCRNYLIFISTFILILFSGCDIEEQSFYIQNPYEEVDWVNDEHHKANLHTHTTISDGRMAPHTVVDKYFELGYTILSITDHNRITYPWSEFSEIPVRGRYLVENLKALENGQLSVEELIFEDRDPSQLDMVAIPGNEISNHNHMNSFFSLYEGEGLVSSHTGAGREDVSIEALGNDRGLLIWNHPMKPRERLKVEQLTDDMVGWYVDYYNHHDHIIGQEINNYKDDMLLWDWVLTRIMPERPVWGFSNDDMHTLSQLGLHWNVFVIPQLSEEWVRRGMLEGRFYFVHAPHGHSGPSPPVIDSIKVDQKNGIINVFARDYNSIEWISGGNILHNDSSLNLNNFPRVGSYVRAILYGHGDTYIGTQPFGIKQHHVKNSSQKMSVSNGVTDIDGNTYKTVIIGANEWMAENLGVTHYRDGTPIDFPGRDYNTWRDNENGAYAWYQEYEDLKRRYEEKVPYSELNVNEKKVYGALYNWFAVNNEAGLCPVGWRVPSDEEWKDLEINLGMKGEDASQAGWRNGNNIVNKLKSTRTEADGHPYWPSGLNEGATNESGFSALPAGYRSTTGYFISQGRSGYWWTATEWERNSQVAWSRKLELDYEEITRFALNKNLGFNVRCIKD